MKFLKKLPDITQCSTTKEKIKIFLDEIQDEALLERIYRFIKYLYFFK